ncbi:hypothetical protein B0H19DRAFT_108209 [Mycena capillaripes]|nr:hypothetical protein B0H19DRAFT_108209 [Mycena capillaripes]
MRSRCCRRLELEGYAPPAPKAYASVVNGYVAPGTRTSMPMRMAGVTAPDPPAVAANTRRVPPAHVLLMVLLLTGFCGWNPRHSRWRSCAVTRRGRVGFVARSDSYAGAYRYSGARLGLPHLSKAYTPGFFPVPPALQTPVGRIDTRWVWGGEPVAVPGQSLSKPCADAAYFAPEFGESTRCLDAR